MFALTNEQEVAGYWNAYYGNNAMRCDHVSLNHYTNEPKRTNRFGEMNEKINKIYKIDGESKNLNGFGRMVGSLSFSCDRASIIEIRVFGMCIVHACYLFWADQIATKKVQPCVCSNENEQIGMNPKIGTLLLDSDFFLIKINFTNLFIHNWEKRGPNGARTP